MARPRRWLKDEDWHQCASQRECLLRGWVQEENPELLCEDRGSVLKRLQLATCTPGHLPAPAGEPEGFAGFVPHLPQDPPSFNPSIPAPFLRVGGERRGERLPPEASSDPKCRGMVWTPGPGPSLHHGSLLCGHPPARSPAPCLRAGEAGMLLRTWP